MNTEITKVDPKEFGLQENQAATIEKAFLPKIVERDEYAVIYKQLIAKELTKELCNEAGDLRRKLVKVRTGIAEIHKTQKAFFLAAGRFVDAWKNKETLPIEQMEENLSSIETYFEKLERERIAKLEGERTIELKKYTDIIPSGLGAMNDLVFQNYLIGIKLGYEAKIKAEQEAEAERLRVIEAEKETARLKAIEDEKIRLENEQLKAEAIEKERQIELERKKQAELLAKQKAEADEKARVEKERQDKIFAEIEAKAKAEREKAELERKKLEDALREAKEIEQKAREEEAKKEAERIAQEEKLSKAPDKAKLIKWVDELQKIDTTTISIQSIDIAQEINAKMDGFKNWAKTQIEKL